MGLLALLRSFRAKETKLRSEDHIRRYIVKGCEIINLSKNLDPIFLGIKFKRWSKTSEAKFHYFRYPRNIFQKFLKIVVQKRVGSVDYEAFSRLFSRISLGYRNT